jgi:hypothetical protein
VGPSVKKFNKRFVHSFIHSFNVYMQVGTHAAVQAEKGLDMTLQCDGVALRIRHVWERITVCIVLASVPDPLDPHVFAPCGSGSISQRYGSGSGSFYHQA